MLVDLSEIRDLLCDPRINPKGTHPLSDGTLNFCMELPILINFDDSVCSEHWLLEANMNKSVIGRRSHLGRTVKNLITRTNVTSERNIRDFLGCLPKNPIILIVGGGMIGNGCEFLYNDTNIRQIAFDIYPTKNIQFIADAHKIPLIDASVDGVIVQAVLEHVLRPDDVVKEIYRVLKPSGSVYAETPFMQMVHEGAYDFTRFTELGHRWLFKGFSEVSRGVIGGPGLSLYWSIRYFFKSFVRNKWASEILSIPFILLALLDVFISEQRKVEAATGVYFLGTKAQEKIPVNQIIGLYRGPSSN